MGSKQQRHPRPGVVHVAPNYGKQHDTDGECWCCPDIETACPECGMDVSPDCWRCEGTGWADWDEADDFWALVVKHKARED